MKHCIIFLLLLSFFSISLVGCDQHREPEADLVYAVPVEINTLDPQKMSWNQDIRIAGCLWEPLVRFKLPEMVIEPAAAASWTVSDDGLVYTFKLRPQARWSNGDAVTSGDFIFAWRRALMPDFAADYVQLFYGITGAHDFFAYRQAQLKTVTPQNAQLLYDQACAAFTKRVGVRAIDEHTLEIRLAKPMDYFIELCAFATFMPNHAKSLAKIIQINTDTGMAEIPPSYWTSPEKLVTNGPYVLSRYRFKRDLKMVQNSYWWNKAKMGNTSIMQVLIENPQTALLAYENHEVDWLPQIPTGLSLAADLVKSGRKDVHPIPWAGTYFYSFNCNAKLADGSNNPLADSRVRRALSMAVDRQLIVRQVTRMNQPIALSFIPPKMIPHYQSPTQAGVSFSIKQARQLLKEAGYQDPSQIKGLSILYNTGGGHEPVAQAIQQMWRKNLGVTVTLQGMEVRAFRERLKSQKYTIARASWIGDYRDPTTFLDKYQSEAGNNDARFKSPSYDALLAYAAKEKDAKKRYHWLAAAERILLQAQPIMPLYHYITLHIYDPDKVKHFYPNAWNFRRLEQIKVTR